MDKNFITNLTSWDYANLAKSAADMGGPEKYVNAIYEAGRAADVANARLSGVIVGVTVGIIVAGAVGIAVYTVVLKRLSSKRKAEIEELISQEKNSN